MAKIIDSVYKADATEGTTHTASLPSSYASTDQLICIGIKDATTGDITIDAASVSAGWRVAQPDEARRSSRMLIVSACGTVNAPPIFNSTDADAWGSFTLSIRHGSGIIPSNLPQADPVGFLNEYASNEPYHKFSSITTSAKNSIIFWVGTTSKDALSPQPGWGMILGPAEVSTANTLIAAEYVGPSGELRPAPYWHSGDSNAWGTFDMDQCVFEIPDVDQVSPLAVPITSGGPRGDIKKIIELFCYTQSPYGGDPWATNPTRTTDPTNGDHLPTPTTIDGLSVDYIESGTPEFAGGYNAKRRVLSNGGFNNKLSGYVFETPVLSGSIGVQQIDFAWPLGSVDRVNQNTPYSIDFSATLKKMIAFHVTVDAPGDRDLLGTVDQGGVYFYIVDGTGHWRAWMFDARGDERNVTTWTWSYIIDPNSTSTMADESATPPDMTDIVSCGIGVHAVNGDVGHKLSRFYVVEPWVVYGGDSATPASLLHLLDYQDGCFCKVLSQQGTSTMYQGILQIGNGVEATYNVESEVTYECMRTADFSIPDIGFHAPDGVPGLIFNLTASCVVDWTDVIFTAKNPQRLEFVTGLGTVFFSGCVFRRCDPAEIKDGHVFDTCIFDKCGSIVSGSPDVQNCIFKNSTNSGGTLKITSGLSTALDGLTGSSFIDNANALEITQAGTYTLDDVQFSGNTVDIINSSGGNVIINLLNGSNPVTHTETAGGTTTLVTPALSITISNPNLVDGTRVRLYNVTQATEIENVLVSGGSGYSYTAEVKAGGTLDTGDLVRMTSMYSSGTTYYNETDESAIVASSDITMTDTQEQNDILTGYGIDGSLQTDFTTDYPNVEIDINSGDTTRQQLLCWLAYITTTSDGIREFFGAVSHEDAGNAKINTAVVDLHIDYVGTGNARFTDDMRLYRDDGTTIFAGVGDNFYAESGKIYVANTNAQETASAVWEYTR